MKRLLTCALCAFLAVLPGCGFLSPQQKASVLTTLSHEHDLGNITDAQYNAAVEAVQQDKAFDWETLGLVGANILLMFLGVPIAMRTNIPVIGRGAPTQKVGLPANKIRPNA